MNFMNLLELIENIQMRRNVKKLKCRNFHADSSIGTPLTLRRSGHILQGNPGIFDRIHDCTKTSNIAHMVDSGCFWMLSDT